MENKNIEYKEIEKIDEFIDAIRIRVDAFIKEQKCEPGWEPDEDDKKAKHFIAIANNKIPYIDTMNFGYTDIPEKGLFFHCANEGKNLT